MESDLIGHEVATGDSVAAAGLYRTENKIRPIEAHRPTLSKQELESVLDCLIHDRLGSGAVAQKFEKTFAGSFGYRHVLSVNSASSAYHLALLALGVGAGESVLLSALSPVQALDAIRYVGANPILIDVDRESFHPSMEAVKKGMDENETAKIKPIAAYILDHTFGSPSSVDVNYLKNRGLKIIEDFTGLVGSDRDGEFFGNAGHISVCGLSEYDLLTTGNGGVVVTSDSKLYNRMHSLRYGGKRIEGVASYDYRLEDFQAAMGLDQISRLGITLARRKKIGQKYLETLRLTKHATFFREAGIDGYLRFPVVINRNHEEVERYFASLQIGVTRVVEAPLHHLMGYARLEYPNSERIYQKAVSIPLYPSLTANNVERIASSLRGLL
jgi:dTDP-4-amino-4,6-dideoxygalactose transaminase